MSTIKIHQNSVISDPNAKYCTADISNMYLESLLNDPQFVRFKLAHIPPAIQDAYGLSSLASNGFVYARINKAWYGLKESGRIANDDLTQHLAQFGYTESKYTKGLFFYATRPISFSRSARK